MTTQLVTPLRNLSYNDIKKRRLLRQSQSKSNVRLHYAPDISIPRTQKKQVKNADYSQRTYQKNQKKGDLNFVKQLFVKKNLNKHHNKSTSPPTASITNNVQATAKKNTLQSTHIHLGSSRQIVRNLIQQSKSERKLLKYNDLRNKFKLSKSRTKSVESMIQKSNLASQRFQKTKTIENPSISVSSPTKKTKIITQTKRDKNLRYLVLLPKQKKNFQELKTSNISSKLQDQVESSISMKKQSNLFDSLDQKMLEQLDRKQDNKVSNDEKILDLLSLEPDQMERNLNRKTRQQQQHRKINYDFGKFAKKFPAGFFKV